MPDLSVKALYLLVAGLFLCLPWPSQADRPARLVFDAAAVEAYHQITRLDPNSQDAVARLANRDASNAAYAYLTLLRLFLEELRTGDERAYAQLVTESEALLRQMRQVKSPSAWRSYCLGRMHLLLGMAALRRQEHIKAARHLRTGIQEIRQGHQRFSEFLPLRQDVLILQSLLATAPPRYHWIMERLSGIKAGHEGLSELQQLAHGWQRQRHFLALESAMFYLLLRQWHTLPGGEKAAWSPRLSAEDQGHPLVVLVLAHLAREAGDNPGALALLVDNPGAARVLPHLHLMEARSQLAALQPLAARQAARRFLRDWKGPEFRAEALQQMAWSYLLEGDRAAYSRIMQQCRQASGQREGDAQAIREAMSERIPHPGLLKVRLLRDGGNPEAALATLRGLPEEVRCCDPDRLAYHYNEGRCWQALKQHQKAREALETTWRLGQGQATHFACAAALQLGHLYADTGQLASARIWYERCLKERPDTYRESLHHKAQQALRDIRW